MAIQSLPIHPYADEKMGKFCHPENISEALWQNVVGAFSETPKQMVTLKNKMAPCSTHCGCK